MARETRPSEVQCPPSHCQCLLFGERVCTSSSIFTRAGHLKRGSCIAPLLFAPILARPSLLLLLLLCSLLSSLLRPAFALSAEQAAPRIAHPPNQVHIDKRFGVTVEPGMDLFTGDVVVLTVEDDSGAGAGTSSGSSGIFRVWGLDKLGQVTCRDPVADAYTYGAAYTGDGYGNWAPSLANMWAVNVVDGRLGELTLSPVVTFPNSAKYVTPLPAQPRSGVLSSIGGGGWGPGDDLLSVGGFTPPGDPMFAYGLHFNYDADTSQYSFSQEPQHAAYGFTPYTSGYFAKPAEGSGDGYESGRMALRGSSFHDFCRCESDGYVRCRYLGQPMMLFPDPARMTPVYSWFKATKIPSTVVRRMMENYQAAVSGGLPRSFLLFSALPFTDRVDAVHYHGAEAQLSSRRAFLGQSRLVTRGTRLEQQSTLVIENTITDAITFSVDVGFTQEGAISITDLPGIVLPFDPFNPFPLSAGADGGGADGQRRSVMGAPPGALGNDTASTARGAAAAGLSSSLRRAPAEFALERDRQTRKVFAAVADAEAKTAAAAAAGERSSGARGSRRRSEKRERRRQHRRRREHSIADTNTDAVADADTGDTGAGADTAAGTAAELDATPLPPIVQLSQGLREDTAQVRLKTAAAATSPTHGATEAPAPPVLPASWSPARRRATLAALGYDLEQDMHQSTAGGDSASASLRTSAGTGHDSAPEAAVPQPRCAPAVLPAPAVVALPEVGSLRGLRPLSAASKRTDRRAAPGGAATAARGGRIHRTLSVDASPRGSGRLNSGCGSSGCGGGGLLWRQRNSIAFEGGVTSAGAAAFRESVFRPHSAAAEAHARPPSARAPATDNEHSDAALARALAASAGAGAGSGGAGLAQWLRSGAGVVSTAVGAAWRAISESAATAAAAGGLTYHSRDATGTRRVSALRLDVDSADDEDDEDDEEGDEDGDDDEDEGGADDDDVDDALVGESLHRTGVRASTFASQPSLSSSLSIPSTTSGSGSSAMRGRGDQSGLLSRARGGSRDAHVSPAMREHARKMKTMQTILPLIDIVTLGEVFAINFGLTFLYQSIIGFGGEYSLVVPPNTAHIGHIVHHVGYSHVPFSLDLVRQEAYWPAQWIADMHLPSDPVSTVNTDRFNTLSTAARAATGQAGIATAAGIDTSSVGGGALRSLNRTSDGQPMQRGDLPASAAGHPLFSTHRNVRTSQAAKERSPAAPPPAPQTTPFSRRGRSSFTTMQSGGSSGGFLTDFCINPFLESDPVPFTVRGASVEMDLYSLVNPLGLLHPAYELHHFAISGTYSATNTFFVEFVIERTS